MAKIKKKKLNRKRLTAQQRKAKRAQQYKNFLRKLKEVSRAAGALDAFRLIPKDDLDMIVATRVAQVLILPAKDCQIEQYLISLVQNCVLSYLKTSKCPIIPDGKEISLSDYFTAALTLRFWVEFIEDDRFPGAKTVKEAFAPLINYIEKNQPGAVKLMQFLIYLECHLNYIDHGFFWFSFNTEENKSASSRVGSYIDFHYQKPQIKMINLKGKKRPAYRVGHAEFNEGITWAKVKPADLKLENKRLKRPLKVYVQSHALRRLNERLDCFDVQMIQANIYLSLNNVKTIKMENGTTLIEYRILDKKLGYLVVEIVSGILLIRTFLFLTNHGTPEGENLTRALGADILDKKYCKIDQLSTFTKTDLPANEQLKDLFTGIGCGSLFEFAEKDFEKNAINKQASNIIKYFGLAQ